MKTRIFLLASMALLASLIFTGAVFAEGEDPQAPAAEVTPSAPDQEPLADEEPINPETATPPAESEQDAVIAEGADPAEAPAGETATAGETQTAEVIEAAPDAEELTLEAVPAEEAGLVEEPQVVLIDTRGEILDMASQESAEVIVSADPYFTVGSITYRFSNEFDFCSSGDPFCFDGDTPDHVTGNAIQFAINYIKDILGVIPTDGKIYVENATYSENITIDAGAYPILSTLKGLIGLANPTTGVFPTINGFVDVGDLTTGFTLSGFNINGAVTIDNVTGVLNLKDLTVHNTNGTGILVSNHKGNANLTNVKSSYNRGRGAQIQVLTTGTVSVLNSAFDGNDYADGSHYASGLAIITNGIVSIDGLSASRNNGEGLRVLNFSKLTLKNAVLNENKTVPIDSNYGYGLMADTTKAAPVTLEAVYANDNSNVGLYITTGAGAISLNHIEANDSDTDHGAYINNTTATVSISNSSFSDNGNTGLLLYSLRAITLTSIRAENNTGSGAHVDNCILNAGVCTGSGAVTLTSPAAGGTLGANIFSNNTGGHGLEIESYGIVTLTNLEAYSNAYDGLYIQNDYGTAGITINKNLADWTNDFWGNGYRGIELYTKGSVNLSRCTAHENDHEGIIISGAGAITLTDVEAHNNGLAGTSSGLSINNSSGTGGVTIRSTVLTDEMDFSGNTLYGIYINSKGAVSVNSVKVNDNGGNGLYIENNTNPTASPTVTITNGEFNNNNYRGIVVRSKGAITLTNVSANGSLNGQHGVDLDNTYGTASSVTIRSSTPSVNYEFIKNTGRGIQIYSNGTITVSNVLVFGNTFAEGLYASNSGSGSSPAVNVTHSEFNSNGAEGAVIYSKGLVTLTDVSASDNDFNHSDGLTYSGIRIDNSFGAGGVTIKSSSKSVNYPFKNNTFNGITIESKGVVSVNNVTASENYQYGLYVINTSAAGIPAVSVTLGIFENNLAGGVKINSRGAITLTDTSANSNGSSGSFSGAELNNSNYTDISSGVTITSSVSTNRFSYNLNTFAGIRIFSNGVVTVNNVNSEKNDAYGVIINNSTAVTAKNVNVARSHFSDNAWEGLYIQTIGSVTMDSIQSSLNGFTGIGYSGVYINACIFSGGCLGKGSITLLGSGNEFSNNRIFGMDIVSYGSISLSNFSVDGNMNNGLNLYNQYSPSTAGVTISASTGKWNSASSNEGMGVNIFTYGPIAITRLKADGNIGKGAYLYNNNGASKAVTLNDCSFNSNEGTGVDIHTTGLATLNGVTANWNSIHYGTIDEDAGETVYERLTSDTNEDKWRFTGEAGDNYTIELLGTEFDGLLELYEISSDTLVAWDDTNSGGLFGTAGVTVRIVNPLILNTGDYYLRVSGGTGDYILYFNNWTRRKWSDYYGANIQNTSGSSGVSINSTAVTISTFDENNLSGINISNTGNPGAISITNTSARGNGYNGSGDGLHIVSGGNVSITTSGTTLNSSFDRNSLDGIYILNQGNISLSGRISINSNLQNGARLLNYDALTPKTITVIGATANENDYGFEIQSLGSVTLSNITANGNTNTGCRVDNYKGGLGSGNLTITGVNTFSDNLENGLGVDTNGTASITGVTAERNGNHGLALTSLGAGKTVSIKSVNTLYNAKMGLNLNVAGTTTLDAIKSYFNGNDGIYLFTSTAINVTIKNSTLIGNKDSGIELWFGTPGTYSIMNTSYFGNDTDHDLDKDLYIH